MLEEYFWTAYHPIGRESEKPITGTNEVYVPGVFGDMFDVIFAYPDVSKWTTIDTYPVVIAAGDIELTAAEGQRLAQYVEQRRHAAGRRRPPDRPRRRGAEAAGGRRRRRRPTATAGSASSEVQPSQRFRYRPIAAGERAARRWRRRPTARCFCAAFDRGQGRLIYLSVPRGLGIDQAGASRSLPRLFAHLTRGLMPVEVDGDVRMAGQPHADRLAGDAAQPRRPGQAAAGHHADRLPREPPGDDRQRTCRSRRPATACCRTIR